MIIRVEPKDFFMSTILLLFDRGHPDPEDEEVKRYLAERALEPKRTFDAASQEQDGVVWQFGGCDRRHPEKIPRSGNAGG